jgi:murein DD-endopeptidase MepM/ murein hydrolase activator NlpD
MFDDIAVAKYPASRKKGTPGYTVGTAIRDLQSALQGLGYDGLGAPDGDFGAKTAQAVKDFQADVLTGRRYRAGTIVTVPTRFAGPVTGVCDAATLHEVEAWSANGWSRPRVPAPFLFPLAKRPAESYHDGERRFGAARDNGARTHAGCDLYAPVGTEVRAVKDGTVVLGPYDFYRGTVAVEVNHGDFIIRYGEMQRKTAPGISQGVRVRQGQTIGYVGQLEGMSMSMLHFEMYAGTASGPLTNAANPPYMRRSDLLDPTARLDGASMTA